ncbi:hypothetical protein B0H13DRAFT_2374625 [Mycena leptocephala]|nr:hypothetical protein B0H13DRAFT_2374625 [Mycena leptocephala]
MACISPGPLLARVSLVSVHTLGGDAVRRHSGNLSPGKVLYTKYSLFEGTPPRPRPEQFPHKRGPLAPFFTTDPALIPAPFSAAAFDLPVVDLPPSFRHHLDSPPFLALSLCFSPSPTSFPSARWTLRSILPPSSALPLPSVSVQMQMLTLSSGTMSVFSLSVGIRRFVPSVAVGLAFSSLPYFVRERIRYRADFHRAMCDARSSRMAIFRDDDDDGAEGRRKGGRERGRELDRRGALAARYLCFLAILRILAILALSSVSAPGTMGHRRRRKRYVDVYVDARVLGHGGQTHIRIF